MYSNISLKIYTAICEGIIKSRTSFWRDFASIEKIESLNIDCSKYEENLIHNNFNVICCFDYDFPISDKNIPLNDRPFIFIYKGNLDLIKDISNNVAVIGVLNPNNDIIQREQNIVTKLVQNDICIVSGLAKGCDTVAHLECLNCGGKTIAFLPSTIDKIYPYENTHLANNIVANGGLIITEYVFDPQNYKENISRLIDRDRLQAMFSKSVILIASYRKGEGDSGSRHAMIKVKKYNRQRFVMYNDITDKSKSIFGLNEDMIIDGANILTHTSIKDLLN